MTVPAAKRNTVSALFKNGKFDLTSPSSKPTWPTEFQYETRPVLKHRLCCFFVLKYSWRHSKRAPSRDQNLKGILTPGNFVQQVSFDAWNINPLSQTLLRHLNPSQSCNGYRLYFGVLVRFNTIPFDWFLRTVSRCKPLLYVRIASRTYSNLVGGACGPSNAECIAIIEKMSWVTWYAHLLVLLVWFRMAVQQITWCRSRTTYWLLINGSIKAHWLMTLYAAVYGVKNIIYADAY